MFDFFEASDAEHRRRLGGAIGESVASAAGSEPIPTSTANAMLPSDLFPEPRLSERHEAATSSADTDLSVAQVAPIVTDASEQVCTFRLFVLVARKVFHYSYHRYHGSIS